jgi:hypothetical protein
VARLPSGVSPGAVDDEHAPATTLIAASAIRIPTGDRMARLCIGPVHLPTRFMA